MCNPKKIIVFFARTALFQPLSVDNENHRSMIAVEALARPDNREDNPMLSLTRLAAISRQYGVPFEVQFTAQSSFAWVGGTPREHAGSLFMKATKEAGARWRIHDSGMRITLESLS
jgi:hypothetical protein